MKQAQIAVDDKDTVAARCRQFLREIDRHIEEAAVAVNTARETHAAAVAEAIAQGGKPPTATGVKASRSAETDLEDQREAIQSSIDTIRQDKAAAAAELECAERAVQAAIASMLEPEARKLLEEAQIHRTEYLKRVYAIDAIRVLIPDDIIKQVEILGCYNAPGNRDLSASIQKSWQAALEQLKRDPDAELPFQP